MPGRRWVLWFLVSAALCLCDPAIGGKIPPPGRMLWVWAADTDLRFLQPADAGIAWLAMTIWLDGRTGVATEPRSATLVLGPGLYQMAVIRLETAPAISAAPAWTAEQRRKTVASILDLVRITGSRALQIDFDAPLSARPFYRELLAELRRKLDSGVFLRVPHAAPTVCAQPLDRKDSDLVSGGFHHTGCGGAVAAGFAIERCENIWECFAAAASCC